MCCYLYFNICFPSLKKMKERIYFIGHVFIPSTTAFDIIFFLKKNTQLKITYNLIDWWYLGHKGIVMTISGIDEFITFEIFRFLLYSCLFVLFFILSTLFCVIDTNMNFRNSLDSTCQWWCINYLYRNFNDISRCLT